MSGQSPKSSETSSRKESTLYPKNRFRTKFLHEMRYGENGNYSKRGFRASEIYYAMTAEVPEIYEYHRKVVNGIFVPDLTRPIYKIDTLDEFQQEFILDGLRSRYEDRLKKLDEFHAAMKRENDEKYQNFICYMQQKSKAKTEPDSQQCLPLL